MGEEAVAVGACANLSREDLIVSTHRGHGHCIAKGADIKAMMAELLGKATGCCKGKGGSMHIAEVDVGILGASGIVASGIPVAVGAAFSQKYKNTGRVVISFFGDGATNNGAFHESLNLASIWKLPIVFICENNLYAITVPASISTSVRDIAIRATSYSIPGVIADGNDVEDVYHKVSEAVRLAKSGSGPSLIEAKTYRHEGHWVGDQKVYRTRKEEQQWYEKDPVTLYSNKLIAENLLSSSELDEIYSRIGNKISDAEAFAKDSPFPDKLEVYKDIYT
ncbi:MAG: thiamine pyrophosphate-dependent dehydrogenase E1 component subunit alpha, partial [Actinobacteria bacterium]|nr:thiamine pyrophosphate-dependent dehydrogenase E1 component subunit alpha [Actinomycetota bacterium]